MALACTYTQPERSQAGPLGTVSQGFVWDGKHRRHSKLLQLVQGLSGQSAVTSHACKLCTCPITMQTHSGLDVVRAWQKPVRGTTPEALGLATLSFRTAPVSFRTAPLSLGSARSMLPVLERVLLPPACVRRQPRDGVCAVLARTAACTGPRSILCTWHRQPGNGVSACINNHHITSAHLPSAASQAAVLSTADCNGNLSVRSGREKEGQASEQKAQATSCVKSRCEKL